MLIFRVLKKNTGKAKLNGRFFISLLKGSIFKMEEHNYHLHITGKVQGVFYRKSTREVATALGLKGWVRNEPDGSVKAEVYGNRESCLKLIDWCHKGPPAARVDAVRVSKIPFHKYDSFEVIR
jgi:acylphosphatase